MTMEKEIQKSTELKMNEAIDALKKDFTTIRTGRATTALVDNVLVDYYGTPTKLAQCATVTTPDSKTILIQPWEPKLIQAIDKAIMKADLGLTPINDGKNVRISIPALTEERRKDLVKVIKKRTEEGRISVRNIRRDANDSLKKLEKDKSITEDELKKSLEEVQHLTDKFVKRVEETLEHKEKEIMEV